MVPLFKRTATYLTERVKQHERKDGQDEIKDFLILLGDILKKSVNLLWIRRFHMKVKDFYDVIECTFLRKRTHLVSELGAISIEGLLYIKYSVELTLMEPVLVDHLVIFRSSSPVDF